MRYMVNATLIPRKRANSDEDVDPIEVMSNLLKQKNIGETDFRKMVLCVFLDHSNALTISKIEK